MDGGVLPLAFYCRNAQLCLQKAAESRQSNLGEEELQHLKAFTALVTSSIPTHPQFRGWKDIQEIQPLDLHAHIAEAKQRIRELEDSGHLDRPSPTTNGQKHVTRPPSKPVEPSPVLSRSATKSMTSPRSKLNSPSKFSSEVMLKTSKSVRITEAAPKQRPQRWDIETYGVAKTTTAAKPVSLIQRLKRGSVAQPADSKASPTRAPCGKDVARPLSAQGVHTLTSGEITPYRPTPRSRDSSRMRGGAGPSTTLSGRGSTGLKALTSSTVKVRTSDEDGSLHEKPSNISNRGMRDNAENGVSMHNNRGSAPASGTTRPACTPAGKPKLGNHHASGGPWVRGILRNSSDDTAADSNGAMAKTNLDDEEELIQWIPSRKESARVSQRSSNEGGYNEESSVLEVRQRGQHQGELREEPRRPAPARGLGLREWKGGFVRGEQRFDESRESLDATTGAGAQELWANDGSRRIVENRPASAPVRRAPARIVKGTLPSPGAQRGVKENCERFRRQMRLLKEKAEDTRMREEEVESMAERLQRRLVDEIDLDGDDIWRSNTQIHVEEEAEELCEVHRVGKSSSSFHTVDQPGLSLERTSLESLNRTMTRLMNGDYSDPSTPPLESVGRPDKKIKTIAGSASNSGSSTSSQTSLPLSHYIQKLRDSRLKNAPGNGTNQHRFEVMEHKFGAENGDAEMLSMAVARTDSSERRELSLSASSPGSSTAILLPTSSSSGSPKLGSHRHPLPLHFRNRLKSKVYHNRITKSDSSSVAMVQTSPHGQHLTTISSSGAMVAASHLQEGGKLQDQQALYYPPDESRARVLSRSIYESAHHDANDERIAQLQRVLGELKGSMEGVKIRIEVEGEGWRGRIDRLEKELESLKETDDEVIAVKHSFKNELKMKLSEFMADTEKLLRQEREQVQMMVEERIEKQLKTQQLGSTCWADMKDEMHLLWNEMDSLIKGREDMAGHVEHLTFVTKKVQEHSSQEQDMLKSENGFLRKQLQSLQGDNVQVSSETDREDLRQALEKLKNDGIDMKLEIQGLKNIEKILKVELGELRTRLGKVQDETEELEREKEMTLVEGARERHMIMERVESLSQLYLGGLEEVRQDLGNVKFGCSERVEEIESQWNEFKRNQGITCEEGTALLPRQVLLDELDQFRCEIAEMVDIERGLLKETLEMESTSIWRKVMDAYANNKSEMLNMLKQEIQKQLHSAREKVLLMTDALKRDMDTLKTELSHTQSGAEELSEIILAAEGKKEVAAQAAADATSSATKAREILNEMLVSVESEVTHARHESMLLQGNLATEKDLAIAAASEARMVSQEVLKEKEAALVAFQEVRQKSQELQDYLEKESPKLVTAMVVVQKERDTASQAATEATSSAMKAGEVLAEVLGSFNLEMAKARHINMQLQEELEYERRLGTQHSQEVQDRLSEELEVAIATWKHAMNEEVAKAKEVSEGVDKENLRQLSGFSTPFDLESYISKTEEKLSSLMTTIEQLQDSTNNHRDDKKRLKQHENERNEKDWTANMSQLNQVVRTAEERVNETSSEQTELRKRLKRSEGIQTDLIHSVGEVRSNTCTLEKTVNLFLPQYDAAARIVNDISCKVERLEERIEGFACDEGLAQVISRVAETKIESLKELTSSTAGLQDLGRDLRDLQDRVENNAHSHCQAIAEVETRVAVVECTLSDIQNGGQSEKAEVGTLTESVDALQRKMDILEQNGVLSGDQEPVTGARMSGLESRVEHVASATFNNLQLLDNKVERVSMGVQSALDGAALAENKCGALGAELVKVFRMLTATKISNNAASVGGTNWPQLPADDNNRAPRGRSHSPPSRTQRLESRSQSPPPRLSGNPAWNSSRGPQSPLRRSGANPTLLPSRPKAGVAREKRIGVRGGRNVEEGINQSSELRKVETRERPDRAKESFSGEAEFEPGMRSRGGSPPKDDNWLKSYPRESLPFKESRFPGRALTVVEDRQRTGPYLAIDRRAKNLQKTNIRLESGRIHVNVSRRSGAASGGAI